MPDRVDLPYELADAAAEALRSSRADLVTVLASRHAGEVLDADGAPLTDVEAGRVLAALAHRSPRATAGAGRRRLR